MHEHSGALLPTGSLGDIGIPPHDAPMGLSGWFAGVHLMRHWVTTFSMPDTIPRPRIGASHRRGRRCG